jgi:hypothetical protein
MEFKKKGICRAGMLGRHVFPHPGQGGEDGPVLKILQRYQSQQFKR